MKPPMRQSISISIPKLDDKGKPMLDKYSKPIVEDKTFKCRVRENGGLKQTNQISVEDARDEIDVMPSTPVNEGMSVSYKTIGGAKKTGKIAGIVESTNISASRVNFRTLIING